MSEIEDVIEKVWGRIVNHDPLSRLFEASRAPEVVSVSHAHNGPVLDQGQLGSCTANAACQAMNTEPYRSVLASRNVPALDENHAVALYSWATKHDGLGGVWPPTDTGSSGLAVAKGLKSLGLIKSYTHAFGLKHALEALVLKPVIIGTVWTDAMESPDADGTIHFKGNVVGGHETALVGIDLERKRVRGLNSWSDQWGDKGFYWLSFDDLDALLHPEQ